MLVSWQHFGKETEQGQWTDQRPEGHLGVIFEGAGERRRGHWGWRRGQASGRGKQDPSVLTSSVRRMEEPVEASRVCTGFCLGQLTENIVEKEVPLRGANKMTHGSWGDRSNLRGHHYRPMLL